MNSEVLLCYAGVDEWPDVVLWLDKMTPGWGFVADDSGQDVRSRIFDPEEQARTRSRYTGYGLTLRFQSREHLMLCKLAWGGKDRSVMFS